MRSVPIENKVLLTLEEASEYVGLGINRLRTLSYHDPDFADCVYVAGRRRMFKREALLEYFRYASGGDM